MAKTNSTEDPMPEACDYDTEENDTILPKFQEDEQINAEASDQPDAETNQKTLRDIKHKIAQLLQTQAPDLLHRPLLDLNAEAAKHIKAGDYITAVAIYSILFNKAAKSNITHPELHVCHSNCAAAYLKLELYEPALQHADRCRRLAEQSLRRNFKGSSSYIKSFERKGNALLGLARHREAAATFEEGLKVDAFNIELKRGLEQANQGVVKDLLEGKGLETCAITYPQPSQRISYHPYSAPLHKVRTEDMLPVKLLTPFQAENDHNIKDTYNYVTVQTDIQMPKRQLTLLECNGYNATWHAAIKQAVADIEAEDKDCRVLNLGAGAGLHAALALQAGAHHVTAVERWLYLALSTKETLAANKFHDDSYKVIYKRPTDLTLIGDVPVCCNLLLAGNIFEEGLLASGIVPALHHSLGNLLTTDAVLIPSSATVFMQAVEIRTTDVCGFDMSAANLYRWHPAYVAAGAGGSPVWQQGKAGVPSPPCIKRLSKPVEVWYFSFGSPPEKSDVKTVDVEFVADGRFNAVMFWFELNLYGDHKLTTEMLVRTASASSQAEQGSSNPPHTNTQWLQPAVQYLAGELPVQAGSNLPVIASHNTVRMRFDIETADYVHLMKPDASFPHRHFTMLADTGRLEAYQRAITRAVQRCKKAQGEVHVLDMGCGTGIFSLMAAKAGATSVVACDLHPSLCDIARKAAAANQLADKVSVVHRDVGLLQRGKEVRPLGVNLVTADMFDSGLFGDQFPYLLELAKRKVVQPDAVVVPAAATVYCMGVELLTGEIEGFDFSEMNKYRWDASYESVGNVTDLPQFRQLTTPVRVLEHYFDTSTGGDRGGGGVNGGRSRTRDSLLKLPVIAEGAMNAVVCWFDLHLDDVETISNAPSGIVFDTEPSATPRDPSSLQQQQEQPHHWGNALQYLDRAIEVDPGRKVTLLSKREGSKLTFSLRPGVGEWVDRAPWKIEWGGGASVENPHYQRVHYCELLVRDFLQRVKSKRFPSIEKDMKMVLAHCGSLFLDPAALQSISHELVVLEKIHSEPEFSPGASLEAVTKRPLWWC